MKKLAFFTLIVLLTFACTNRQETKQYFEESPEIEVVKKLIQAYNDQDWATFESFYSDTAKIWYNSHYMVDEGVAPDESIKGFKTIASNMDYREFTDNRLFEMVVTNDGLNWVHFWGKHVAKFSGIDEETTIVTHIDYNFKDGKIVSEVGYWDNLPAYLAMEKMESKKEE